MKWFDRRASGLVAASRYDPDMAALLLAALAGLCWGIGELFTKSVLHTHQVGPFTAIAIRSTVALPMIWLAWLASDRGLFGLKPEPSISL